MLSSALDSTHREILTRAHLNLSKQKKMLGTEAKELSSGADGGDSRFQRLFRDLVVCAAAIEVGFDGCAGRHRDGLLQGEVDGEPGVHVGRMGGRVDAQVHLPIPASCQSPSLLDHQGCFCPHRLAPSLRLACCQQHKEVGVLYKAWRCYRHMLSGTPHRGVDPASSC